MVTVVIHVSNEYPYDTACNVVTFKALVGPLPPTVEDAPAANAYYDISSLQSAHITSYNGTGDQLVKGSL